MGIYSEDRTMLTVDPNAESKVIEGYSTINDLYRIMEESIHDDSIISRAIYESMASVLSLDEADGAKIDKRVNTICKIAKANNAKLAKVIAKTKSVCAGTKDGIEKYSIGTGTSLSKYEEKFNRNKDLASSSKFTIKYNKENLKFTEDYINKFASNAGKALKDIANNSINIAIKDTENINKNKNNIFKIAAIEKYAKNLCICEEKSKQINGNPFTDGFTVSKLEKDLSSFNNIKGLDSFCSNATQALEIFAKNTNKLCEKVKNSKKDVSQEDIDVMRALTVLSSAIGKATIHVIKDIINAYSCYINECIRVYIGVAKLKAVRVTKEAAEPTKNDVVKEAAEPTKNDTVVKEAAEPTKNDIVKEAAEPTKNNTIVKEEIEAVKNDDNLENSKKIEGEFEDDLSLITDGDIEKILNNAPEDETKKDEGIDPVKPSDVPMNDGSAHEAAEPTKNDKDTSLSDSTIIYTDTIEAVAEAYIISQELKFMTEMNI